MNNLPIVPKFETDPEKHSETIGEMFPKDPVAALRYIVSNLERMCREGSIDGLYSKVEYPQFPYLDNPNTAGAILIPFLKKEGLSFQQRVILANRFLSEAQQGSRFTRENIDAFYLASIYTLIEAAIFHLSEAGELSQLYESYTRHLYKLINDYESFLKTTEISEAE